MAAPKPILLAENDEGDLILMRLSFKLARIPNSVVEVNDGQEAIDYLHGKGKFANRDRYPLPCLIITDLQMPRVDGLELLAWLREQPRFAEIPRIMLTGSGENFDRKRATALGACAYFKKPSGIQPLVQLIKHLDENWLSDPCPRHPLIFS